MFDVFEVPWAHVRVEHVLAFIGEADEEGVTWEAKADDERGSLRPDSIRKAACGLANQIGGYIIVGAKRDQVTGRWDLPASRSPTTSPSSGSGKCCDASSPSRASTRGRGSSTPAAW
jgi:hypothetical protein